MSAEKMKPTRRRGVSNTVVIIAIALIIIIVLAAIYAYQTMLPPARWQTPAGIALFVAEYL